MHKDIIILVGNVSKMCAGSGTEFNKEGGINTVAHFVRATMNNWNMGNVVVRFQCK